MTRFPAVTCHANPVGTEFNIRQRALHGGED